MHSRTHPLFFIIDTENGRVQYGPSKYPGLPDEIMDTIQLMLGPEEYKLVVDGHRAKLRMSMSSLANAKIFTSYCDSKSTPTVEIGVLGGCGGFAMGACGSVSWVNDRCCNGVISCSLTIYVRIMTRLGKNERSMYSHIYIYQPRNKWLRVLCKLI